MENSTKHEVKADHQLNGIITVMSGFWKDQDVTEWANKFLNCYNSNFSNKPFKVLADMRGFKPATKEVQDKVAEIQKNAKNMKLTASAVITDSVLSQSQMKRIANETGVSNTEDYFIDYNTAYNWLKSK